MRRQAIVVTALLALAVLVPPVAAGRAGGEFGRAEAEHLLNRAGFGGTPAEIDHLVELGRKEAVRLLVEGPRGYDPAVDLPSFEPTLRNRPQIRLLVQGLSPEERRKKAREISRAYRRKDRRQLVAYRVWWADRMVRTRHPLIEKMVLFWHGHFTSSQRDVRNSYHMILQNELFRRHALGNFGDLLHDVSRDPAMLEYLDNNRNRKGKPNENFAREVMELFTLGLGNYTEKDIKEAARAFTGWTFRQNEFVMRQRWHDRGVKTFLGQRGRFDGADILDILLDHPAAPRHIAGKLIDFFVGPNAPKGMVERYARLFRRHDWELEPVLRALFADPDFYREEVMFSRIMGPVELLVSHARRLGVTPPGRFLVNAATLLGQSLFDPPNVKGWEGGEAWISTASYLMRGNLTSYLVTGVSPGRVRHDFMDEDGRAVAGMMRAARRLMPALRGQTRWRSPVRVKALIAGLETPEAIVDHLADRLLAVPITDEARQSLVGYLRAAGTRTSRTFRVPSEFKLKRLVRILLSLPEAQIN